MVEKTKTKSKSVKKPRAHKAVHHKPVKPTPVKIPVVVNSVKPVVKTAGYIFTVGRKKEAVARVRLFNNGKGDIIINGKLLNQYFPNFEHQFCILQPLKVSGLFEKINLQIKVGGGGKVGQADAIRHGISRALVVLDEKLRKTLKPYGFLTRDARVKERKKPGLKKARRAPQWQKR